uniref:Glycosyltransferase n=1 Tax=Heterorhabditis bacteriophora TaxID=37862 RepID=A0A1I7XI13_HETBA
MDRKAGGLAAIMAGQPIVKKKRDLRELVKQIASNYFDSVFYNQGQYEELWTMDAAVLFTSTTMVPVG